VGLVIGLVLVGIVLAGAWYLITNGSQSSAETMPLTTAVELGPFVDEVIESGEVESSSNVEIRCEVQSRSSAGTTILEIVPEGTYVEEGDFLVKLDDAALQTELLQQEIVCNTSHSLLIDAQADLEAAQLELEEYGSGTFKQEKEQLESAEFVAQENMRRAEEYLGYSEQLAERGYVSEVQLEADRFAVEKAIKELAVARTRLDVLTNFTKRKMLNRLEAAIKTAETRLKSRQSTYDLDKARLDKIKDQIAKCEIRATASGQVVYANSNSLRIASGTVLIAEGLQVRERQVIIRLPDPKNMQVVAKIHESRVDRVKQGMKATIRVDAFPDLELTGTVRKVGEYPIPQMNRYLEHIKEYATDVEIHDPPEGLRAGMNAEVAIQVERLEEALQVPPQAVIQRDGRYFCKVSNGEELEDREVRIGSANETFVVVEHGLRVGEQVVLNPHDYEEESESDSNDLANQERKPTTSKATSSTKKSLAKGASKKAR
jgi:multidrug efflux pump subunit AcrA (membrane-fusion protein)